MREDLAQQHRRNERIRKECELQRYDMDLHRASAWNAIERSLACAAKSKDLIEKASRLIRESERLCDQRRTTNAESVID